MKCHAGCCWSWEGEGLSSFAEVAVEADADVDGEVDAEDPLAPLPALPSVGAPPSASVAADSLAAASNRGTASATGVIMGASVCRLSAATPPAASVASVPPPSLPAGEPNVAGGTGFLAPSEAAAAASAACFFNSASRVWRSKSRISSSNALLKSPEALRNSAISLPRLRASSGSFCGPNTTRTTMNTTIMCGMLNIQSRCRQSPGLHHNHRCMIEIAAIQVKRQFAFAMLYSSFRRNGRGNP